MPLVLFKTKTELLKKTHLICALLACASIATAQNYIDLAKFDYASSPSNAFDSSAATTTLHEMNGNLSLPIVVSDDFTILTGVIYENTVASFNPNRGDEYLTGLCLKLGANFKHNEKWSGTYLLLPKISSDFKGIGKQDIQLGGAVVMKYIKSEHFSYKFGVYGNNELFGPFIVPILGFYYLSPSSKFEAKALLPLSLDLNYTVAKGARVGLEFKGQVRSYNVNTSIAGEVNAYVERSTKDLYTYFQYGTEKGLNFQVGLGRSLGRTYRMYNEKVSFGLPLYNFGDNRTQLNSGFSDGWLFRLSVFYRLKLGDDS
ncbi:MAG: hypothetical protein ACI8ZO_001574 [Flavobacteriales bacterium]